MFRQAALTILAPWALIFEILIVKLAIQLGWYKWGWPSFISPYSYVVKVNLLVSLLLFLLSVIPRIGTKPIDFKNSWVSHAHNTDHESLLIKMWHFNNDSELRIAYCIIQDLRFEQILPLPPTWSLTAWFNPRINITCYSLSQVFNQYHEPIIPKC